MTAWITSYSARLTDDDERGSFWPLSSLPGSRAHGLSRLWFDNWIEAWRPSDRHRAVVINHCWFQSASARRHRRCRRRSHHVDLLPELKRISADILAAAWQHAEALYNDTSRSSWMKLVGRRHSSVCRHAVSWHAPRIWRVLRVSLRHRRVGLSRRNETAVSFDFHSRTWGKGWAAYSFWPITWVNADQPVVVIPPCTAA